MPLDPSIARKIAGYQEELRNAAQDNRKRFPQAADFKDAIERVFGPCKVTYAENYETGDKIGVQQRFLPWPDFGKYGDPRSAVSDDKAVSKRRLVK